MYLKYMISPLNFIAIEHVSFVSSHVSLGFLDAASARPLVDYSVIRNNRAFAFFTTLRTITKCGPVWKAPPAPCTGLAYGGGPYQLPWTKK